MWEQKHGFPRFKKVGTMRSFVFPQLGVNPVQNQAVKLPKIGFVKFHQSRTTPDVNPTMGRFSTQSNAPR